MFWGVPSLPHPSAFRFAVACAGTPYTRSTTPARDPKQGIGNSIGNDIGKFGISKTRGKSYFLHAANPIDGGGGSPPPHINGEGRLSNIRLYPIILAGPWPAGQDNRI